MQQGFIISKKNGVKTNCFGVSQTSFSIIDINQFACCYPEAFYKNFKCLGVRFAVANFGRDNNGVKVVNEPGLLKSICGHNIIVTQKPNFITTSFQSVHEIKYLLVKFMTRKFFYEFYQTVIFFRHPEFFSNLFPKIFPRQDIIIHQMVKFKIDIVKCLLRYSQQSGYSFIKFWSGDTSDNSAIVKPDSLKRHTHMIKKFSSPKMRNREFVFTPKIEYKLVAESAERADKLREANQNSLTFPFWCPQEESNLYFKLRRLALYPLSYGG